MADYTVTGIAPAQTGGEWANGDSWFLIDKSGEFSVDKDLLATVYLVDGGGSGGYGYCGNQSAAGYWEWCQGGDGGGGKTTIIFNASLHAGETFTAKIGAGSTASLSAAVAGGTTELLFPYSLNNNDIVSKTFEFKGGSGAYVNKYGRNLKMGSTGSDGIKIPNGYYVSSSGGGGGASVTSQYNIREGFTRNPGWGGAGAGDGGDYSYGESAAYYGCGGGGGNSRNGRFYGGGKGKNGCIVVCVQSAAISVLNSYGLTETPVYSGETITPVFGDCTNENCDFSGTVSATNAGTYSVQITPKERFCWSDGTRDTRTLNWTIKRKPVTVPYPKNSLLAYNGKEQSPEWTGYDENIFTLSGTLNAVDAGTYYTAFTPTANYCWEDGSYSAKNVKWEIVSKIDKPVIGEDPVYNGASQSPSWGNYSADEIAGFFDLSGDILGVNAGDYTIIITPKENFFWSDGSSNAVSVGWKILRKPVELPVQTVKAVYNGNVFYFSALVDGLEGLVYAGSISRAAVVGDCAVDAGDYSFRVCPDSNHCWTDGGIDARDIPIVIERAPVDYPAVSQNEFVYVYSGAAVSPVFDRGLDGLATGGEFSAVDAGNYLAEITPDKNHCWNDGSDAPRFVEWSIKKRGVDVPTVKGNVNFTGSIVAPEFLNYDKNLLKISGDISAVERGDYVAYFEIADTNNYEWADGTAGRKAVGWAVEDAVKSVQKPYQSGKLSYNKSFQKPSWAGFDTDAMMIVGGTQRALNAGIYYVTFRLKDGYTWSDGTTGDITVPWTIEPLVVDIPSVHGFSGGSGGQYTESGGARYPVWDNYDTRYVQITGHKTASDGSTRKSVFYLKDPDNYVWSDGTNSPKTVVWNADTAYSAGSGGGSGSWGGSSGSGSGSGGSSGGSGSGGSWGGSGGGGSGGGSSGGSSSWGGGSGSSGGGSSGGSSGSSGGGSSGGGYSRKFSDNSPSKIVGAIKVGIADKLWNVGDKIPIKLHGQVGNIFLDGDFYAYIIGFNHNKEREGDGTIHLQFGKFTSSEKEIAFVDDKYDVTSENADGFCMNPAPSTSGGWENSYMRNTICKQFFDAMPEDWQNAVVACPKYTDNTGNSNSAGDVTLTRDKIFLPSEFEVVGRNISSNNSEDNFQQQYEYYKKNGYKGKGMFGTPKEDCDCWLRSPFFLSGENFCATATSEYNSAGGCYGEYANTSLGFAPCFVVGKDAVIGLSGGSGGGSGSGGSSGDDDSSGSRKKLVHIPEQVDPPYYDGETKTPEWDEYIAT